MFVITFDQKLKISHINPGFSGQFYHFTFQPVTLRFSLQIIFRFFYFFRQNYSSYSVIMTIFNFKSRKSSSRNTDCPKNPKILLLGALPNSSKLNFFFAYENCRAIGQHRCGQQPAMGVQLNTIPYRHQNNHIFLDIWNFVINFERYDRLASIYWQNTEAIVGVCSLHSVGSFLKMKYWIESKLYSFL